jgi:hypothetical protein
MIIVTNNYKYSNQEKVMKAKQQSNKWLNPSTKSTNTSIEHENE